MSDLLHLISHADGDLDNARKRMWESWHAYAAFRCEVERLERTQSERFAALIAKAATSAPILSDRRG